MCCVGCINTSIRYEEIYGEIGITDTLLTIQGIKYMVVVNLELKSRILCSCSAYLSFLTNLIAVSLTFRSYLTVNVINSIPQFKCFRFIQSGMVRDTNSLYIVCTVTLLSSKVSCGTDKTNNIVTKHNRNVTWNDARSWITPAATAYLLAHQPSRTRKLNLGYCSDCVAGHWSAPHAFDIQISNCDPEPKGKISNIKPFHRIGGGCVYSMCRCLRKKFRISLSHLTWTLS